MRSTDYYIKWNVLGAHYFGNDHTMTTVSQDIFIKDHWGNILDDNEILTTKQFITKYKLRMMLIQPPDELLEQKQRLPLSKRDKI